MLCCEVYFLGSILSIIGRCLLQIDIKSHRHYPLLTDSACSHLTLVTNVSDEVSVCAKKMCETALHEDFMIFVQPNRRFLNSSKAQEDYASQEKNNQQNLYTLR
jgi:hypothetical protein